MKRARRAKFPAWAPAEAVAHLNEYRELAAEWSAQQQAAQNALAALDREIAARKARGQTVAAGERERRRALETASKGDPRQAVPEMLERLLTVPGMERVWGEVRKSPKLFAVEVFAAAAGVAFHEPWDREERLTPRQYERWRRQVCDAANKLADLLRGSALDQSLLGQLGLSRSAATLAAGPRFLRVSELLRARGLAPASEPELYRAILALSGPVFLWESFSHILGRVQSIARHTSRRPVGTKTRGSDAERARFVRHMTGFFREYLGGPRRALVAATTGAAFGLQESISERVVARLAP